MAAGTYDIFIEQGATYEQEFIWKDNQVPPQPINLTGYTARMQIRSSLTGPILIELTTEDGNIDLGTTDGSITLKLSDTETAALRWVTGIYDLELESSTGRVTRLLKGTVTVDPEVTR